MKNQVGYIWRVGRSWFGRWYQDEKIDGVTVRKQHSEKLCEFGDRYRSKNDVRPLLAQKLAPINEGRRRPESTSSVWKYAEEFFLPYAESELKPSTALFYKNILNIYLKAHIQDISLVDFRCVDATNILAAIYRKHGLNRKSLRHCKGLLSAIFMHAKRNGAVDGTNPVTDAGIPRAAIASEQAHAYSGEEILKMLEVLSGTARAAVAVMYFCGLRPGEARGIRWENYDGKVLRVRSSIWRKHESAPKTESSVGTVPVASVLAEILSEVPRTSEFILSTPSGRPVDLHNLAARVIVPALNRCATCHISESKHEKADHDFQRDASLPQWRGYYACRRGLATLATSVDTALAAKSLLRHSNIATTEQHYIKSVPADATRAVDKISALFDNRIGSARPN
jgi:integrase